MTTRFNLPRREMSVAAWNAADNVPFRYVGIINSAEVSFTQEIEEYPATSLSGDECVEYVAQRTKSSRTGTLTIEMMSATAENLAMAFQSGVTIEAGEVESEISFIGIVSGDVIALDYLPDPSTIVLTDSDVGPTTLIEGTHWEWLAKAAGRIRFLDVTGLVEPILVNGSSAARKKILPMSDLNAYWMIDFAGAGEAAACAGEAERFYRAQITEDSARSLHLAAEERAVQPISVTFTLDRDSTRSDEFGYFDVAD